MVNQNKNQSISGTFFLIKQSVFLVRQKYRKILPFLIVIFAINVLSIVLSYFNKDANRFTVMDLLVLLLSLVMFIPSIAIIVLFSHDEKSSSDVSAFDKALELLLPFIWVSILTFLVFFGSAIFFIIPGIIMALVLSQASFIVIFENKRGLSALAKSWYYITNRKGELFLRFLVFFFCLLATVAISNFFIFWGQSGWHKDFTKSIFGSLAPTNLILIFLLYSIGFSISAFIISPLTHAFSYLLYKNLKETRPQEPELDDIHKKEKRLVGLAVLGIIMPIVIGILAVFIFSIIYSMK